MNGVLLDSYAWIELFIGSEKGEKVKQILVTQPCWTSIISIAELSEWAEKNQLDAEQYIATLIAKSAVLNLDEKMLQAAGKTNFHRKKKIKNWGLIDSIILTTAKTYGLNIATGDKHFKDIEETIII